MTAQQLAALRLQGETVHVTSDQMTEALARFGAVLGGISAGKNKDAAALFRHLGIALKDVHGHARTAGDVLPQLADAFARTSSIVAQQFMARTLFGGREGMQLLPLLDQGSAGLKKWAEESKKVDFIPEGAQKKQLEDYEASWITLTHAIKGFKDELGADLSPAMTKLVEQFKDWVTANRDWTATKITDEVKDLVKAVKAIDWNKAIADFKAATAPVRALADALGPVPTAIGAITLAFGAPFIAAITTATRDFIALAGWASRAAPAVGTTLVNAFRDAGAAMDIFDKRFSASRIGAVVNLVAMIAEMAQPKTVELNAKQRALVESWHLPVGTVLNAKQRQQLDRLATPSPTVWQDIKDKFDTLFGTKAPSPATPALSGPGGERPSEGLSGGAGPASLIAPRASPPAASTAQSGSVNMKVQFENAPPGTRVQTQSSGNANVSEVNVGFANVLAIGL